MISVLASKKEIFDWWESAKSLDFFKNMSINQVLNQVSIWWTQIHLFDSSPVKN